MLKAAGKGKSYYVGIKVHCKSTPPYWLTAYFPLVFDLQMKKIKKQKNYSEKQKVRKLRSNSFSISSDLSWKVKGRRKTPPSFPRDIPKTWHDLRQSAPVSGSMKYHENLQSLQEIRYTSLGQQQRINHGPLACMSRSPTPLVYQWVVSHNSFRLCCQCSEIEKDFYRVEEVYHILRSLKLVLLHFIEDFLQHKVRSFF